MKNLYIVASSARNSHYGIGSYVENFRYLCSLEREYCLHILILDSEKEFYTFSEEKNIVTHYYPACKSKSSVHKYMHSVFMLMRTTINMNEDSVFIFNFPNHIDLMERIKEFNPSITVLYILHINLWSFYLNGNEKYFSNVVNHKVEIYSQELSILKDFEIESRIFFVVDKIISLSKDTSRVLQTYYNMTPNKLNLIYNALPDAYQVMSKEEKAALKSSFSYAPDEKLILYVGRIDSMKGVPATIEAFKKLVVKHPECRLLIVGEGNEMETCMQACKGFWNKIAFAGRLERSLIYQLYQIADAGIMLSMHEQCSYVAIEMLMHDIPLIATDTTGLNEMIADSPYKVHLQYTERETIIPIDEVVEKLELALFDPQDYSSRRIYLANYTMDLYCQHMKELFDCL